MSVELVSIHGLDTAGDQHWELSMVGRGKAKS